MDDDDLKGLEKLEVGQLFEADEDQIPPEDVIAYNELRSCADIFRMWQDKILDIAPAYQRGVVWKDAAQARFVDSMMKNLPIPSMCFGLDYRRGRWEVIDGLQRVSTIVKFLGDEKWKIPRAKEIDRRIVGLTVSEIKKKHPLLFQAVQNLTLPITVLRCDLAKRNHVEYIYMIFHRLNTGGTKLTNQEIRNAIFQGSLNDLLRKCDQRASWKTISRRSEEKVDRLKRVESVLRFFAFYDSGKDYRGNLQKFLNDYMFKHRDKAEAWIQEHDSLFNRTVDLIADKLLEADPELPKKSNAFMEALLIGVASNIDALEAASQSDIVAHYRAVSANDVFSESNLSEGLSKTDRVKARHQAAREAFSV